MVELHLPYSDYAKRPGVNATLLKKVDEFSLMHAKAYLDGRMEEKSDEMAFGTSFHALLLEGRKDYSIIPEKYPHSGDKKRGINPGDLVPWNWNADYCKQWRESQQTPNFLSTEEANDLDCMVGSVHECLPVDLLKGEREVSVFAEHDGHPVKCRVDLLPADLNAPVIDFKKTRCAHPEKFLRQSLDKRYHLQAAWTIDVLRWAGMPRKSFWLVGVEAEPPFAVSVLKFNDESFSFLRVGRRHCRTAFALLKSAYESGRWDGYGSKLAEEVAPRWMMPELEATA